MKKYVLSIDQGTTSTRALLINKQGQICFSASRAITCHYPHPGHVEADPEEIFISVIDVINEVLFRSKSKFSDIDCLGITNQRETTIVWEKETGKAIYPAIIWQSKQTLDLCNERKAYEELIKEKTGLLLNPYFSASKIRYILDHVEGAQDRAEQGELLAGTIDSYLIYLLTNKEVFASDVTNAARTLLLNIKTLDYDEELLRIWNIPRCMLPSIRGNSEDYGVASYLSNDLHITGVIGDQQGALFGQGCYEEGEGKNTYGTGCFMLLNTGDKMAFNDDGLLVTPAFKIKDKVAYCLEGSVFIGGALVQWLRDEMNFFKESKDSEEYALRCPSSLGVYVVPSFVGMGTPYWDDEVRGAIFGLTRGSGRHEIARAGLEAIAYQSLDVIKAMEKAAGIKLTHLRVDGGASSNNLLMQFQSDILETEVHLPSSLETTALGAGYLAGLASGFFSSLEELRSFNPIAKVYKPSMANDEVKRRYEGWLNAVKATRVFRVKNV